MSSILLNILTSLSYSRLSGKAPEMALARQVDDNPHKEPSFYGKWPRLTFVTALDYVMWVNFYVDFNFKFKLFKLKVLISSL